MDEWRFLQMQTWDNLEKLHICLDQIQKKLVSYKKRAAKQLAQNTDQPLSEEWDVAFGCLVNAAKLVEEELEKLESKRKRMKK